MDVLFKNLGTGFGTIFLIMIAAVVILLVISLSLNMKINRLKVRLHSFTKGKDGRSLEDEIEERQADIEKINSRQGEHQADISRMRKRFGTLLNHYGIVKYDAFDDVGGKLSFVLAILDDNNTGFVIDSIHSKDNCFVYLKEIVNGESYIMLSEEELQALRIAAGTDDDQE